MSYVTSSYKKSRDTTTTATYLNLTGSVRYLCTPTYLRVSSKVSIDLVTVGDFWDLVNRTIHACSNTRLKLIVVPTLLETRNVVSQFVTHVIDPQRIPFRDDQFRS